MDCDEAISHFAEIRMFGMTLLGEDVVEVVALSLMLSSSSLSWW